MILIPKPGLTILHPAVRSTMLTLRGGCWNNSPSSLRIALRGSGTLHAFATISGLRLVLRKRVK